MRKFRDLKSLLTAASDTLDLSKRAQKSREMVNTLENPRSMEYFKQQGATEEDLQKIRESIPGRRALAIAQSDSLDAMRRQMREASTERAKSRYGGEAIDRATKAGYNIVAETPTAAGNDTTYTWRGPAGSTYSANRGGTEMQRFGEQLRLADEMPPDEESMRQMDFEKQRVQRMLNPNAGRGLTQQAYADSMSALKARRATRRP